MTRTHSGAFPCAPVHLPRLALLLARAMPIGQKLKSRLGAVRVVLDDIAGGPNHSFVSKLQANSLAELIKDSDLTADDAADVGSKVVVMKWHNQCDTDVVMAALLAGNGPAHKRARRANQNFVAVSNYLTATQWETLVSDAPEGAKLTTILQAAARLGLRLPTEPTIKWLCSLWLACSRRVEHLAVLSEHDKRAMLLHCKGSFNTMRSKMADPAEWVDRLPDEPAVFQQQCPLLWTAAMGTAMPGRPAIDLKSVAELDLSYSCRGGRAPMSVRAAPVPLLSGGGHAPLERLASMFMDKMEGMMVNQSKVFELVVGGNGGRQPRSLAALADATVPHITLSPVRRRHAALALDGPSDSPDTGMLAIATDTTSPLPPPRAATSPSSLTVARVEDVTSPPVHSKTVDDINSLLDVFSSRKADKRKAAKDADASRSSGVADVAKEHETGEDEPTTETKAKAKPIPAKVAKAKAKPIPAKPAMAKAKVAPMKVMKAMATKKMVKDELVLGCSKCRWSEIGCGQCRDDSFSGHRWNKSLPE